LKRLHSRSAIRDPQSGGSLLVLFRVFLIETLDTTSSVNQLLLAGEERMAVRADFNVNVFLGRSRRPGMAAGANDVTFDVFWMNSFFHFHFSFYLNNFDNCLQPFLCIATGAKPRANGKTHNYPIISYCVKAPRAIALAKSSSRGTLAD